MRRPYVPPGRPAPAGPPVIQDGHPKAVVTFATLDCIPCCFKEQCPSARSNRRQIGLHPRELTEGANSSHLAHLELALTA
ncbi:hypothetical protein ACWCQN_21545 [Streptomyces sp. NPDC001984]